MTASPGRNAAVRAHYETGDLAEAVLAAVDAAPGETLAALDQFHIGGAKATARLADRVPLPAGAQVLDLGSGLGGPARLLAETRSWDVTGIDLSPAFCAIAAGLSRRTGRPDMTRFCAGDALSLPFDDGVFDAVWTEHVAMNIPARGDLYRELARVVRPGGLLALYDVVAGPERSAALAYPVPWARAPEQSHLIDAAALRAAVSAAGWRECAWHDETAFARDWLANARPPSGSGGPNLSRVMGPDFPQMIANLRANFADGRLAAVQAVFEKPPPEQ